MTLPQSSLTQNMARIGVSIVVGSGMSIEDEVAMYDSSENSLYSNSTLAGSQRQG